MREILKDCLEVFIVTMITILGIGGALVVSGKLDFWGSRLLNEKRRVLAARLELNKKAFTNRYNRINNK